MGREGGRDFRRAQAGEWARRSREQSTRKVIRFRPFEAVITTGPPSLGSISPPSEHHWLWVCFELGGCRYPRDKRRCWSTSQHRIRELPSLHRMEPSGRFFSSIEQTDWCCKLSWVATCHTISRHQPSGFGSFSCRAKHTKPRESGTTGHESCGERFGAIIVPLFKSRKCRHCENGKLKRLFEIVSVAPLKCDLPLRDAP